MTYEVTFTTAAAKQISRLPKPIRERVLDVIESLAVDPRPPGSSKLVGERTAWRVPIGDYRVIYDLVESELTVVVVRAAHRREVYRSHR